MPNSVVEEIWMNEFGLPMSQVGRHMFGLHKSKKKGRHVWLLDSQKGKGLACT